MVASSRLATLLLPLLALPAYSFDVDGCTSIIVSAAATVDGSAFASHANDCADCDWRVAYVPAKDHAPGSKRKVYDSTWSQYPRSVDSKRSAQYGPDLGIDSIPLLGEIPEVEHTYALWEGNYGLMNEHGLAMGESTCSAFTVGVSVKDNGTAIFSIGNLIQLGLERCKTARCAIQTMGDLANKYGFYGEDPGIGGAGEALTIVDKEGEAWVFHIAGGVPTNKTEGDKWADMRGSLWAAQRVPDGHVAVIANSFIMRTVDPTDTENFMVHPGLLELTQEAGLWDGKGIFDWQAVMQPDLATFSYFPGYAPIPMYSTLRMWGVLRQAAPSHNIEPTPHLSMFPFSVPVDKKVNVTNVMDWFRSHYEGTPFDMTLGGLAGPWQTPNRAEGGMGQVKVPGQFARATSIPRTSYTVVLQSGKVPEPTVWYAPDASASSVFVPFFSSVLSHGGKFDLEAYGTGSMKTFQFLAGENGKQLAPAWWAFDFVANWMDLSYNNMSKTYVYPRRDATQLRVVKEATEVVERASKAKDKKEAAKLLADGHTKIQRTVATEWWKLAEMLIVRYNDQFFNFPPNDPQQVHVIGYPPYWLEMLGYDQQSYYPSWFQRAADPPSLLPPDALAALGLTNSTGSSAMGLAGFGVSSPTWGVAAVAVAAGGLLGHLIGYRRGLRAGAADPQESYVKLSA